MDLDLMHCSPTQAGDEEDDDDDDEFQEHFWHSQYLTFRKMFSRVINKVRSPDRTSGPKSNGNNVQGQQNSSAASCSLNAIESFYENLGDGLRNLESSLCRNNESVSCFQVEWLVLGVSFLHSIHLETFALVETVWLPAKSVLGPDSLSYYLDVSMSLLDTCNNLKEALSQLETYQMSLDLILRSLMSAASLSQTLDPEALKDDSTELSYLKPLTECKRELDRLDATNDSYTMWVQLVPKYDLAATILKANSLSRTTSAYPFPATLAKKKAGEVSVVLHDVQVVTSFISRILLWVITGQAGDKQSPTEVKLVLSTKPSVKELRQSSPSPWPTFLFRLKDKVQQTVEYIRKSNSNFMKLQDVTNLQSSLKSLRVELEGGFREGKFVPGTEFAEKIKNVLEQKRQKLTELTKSLERISAHLNEMFSEILERRKKVLDICESRPLYHAFSI